MREKKGRFEKDSFLQVELSEKLKEKRKVKNSWFSSIFSV
jgi:hypothetical protein